MRIPCLAVLVTCLAGCVQVQTEMLVPVGKYEPVPADSVRVFASEHDLERQGYEWELVAMLFASGSADYTSEGGMLRKLREEAGMRGANGILIGTSRDPNLGERLLFGAGAQRKREVMALRWWHVVREPAPVRVPPDSVRTR